MTGRVVALSSGRVGGAVAEGVATFLGIPYGDDTRPRRFRPPRAAPGWEGVRDCTAFGPQAPQGRLNVEGMAVGEDVDPERMRVVAQVFGADAPVAAPRESEDCLTLNVYAPEAEGEGRPVMVWLHGGGFSMGTANSPAYDGGGLCRRGDVVVVGVNHRLGALGYLYLGHLDAEFADSGNAGQLDIVLALEWVRDNIAAFGGDPANVTIFGESGGGAKVAALLAMPPARGLFHKAIIQSGPAARLIERDDAIALAARALATLGIAAEDAGTLQDFDRATLLTAASAAQRPSNGITKGALAPVVDGRSLTSHPFDPAATGLARDVPLLIGTNRDEWTLITAIEPNFGRMTPEQARARFDKQLGEQGRAAFDFYRALTPDDEPTYWVADMMTDVMMRAETLEMAARKAEQGGAPVYMYRLDLPSTAIGGALRSMHGLDIPLVFDAVGAPAPPLVGSPHARALAATMSQAWIDFARTGDPGASGLAWPAYKAPERHTMIFDATSRVVADPDPARRRFWNAG